MTYDEFAERLRKLKQEFLRSKGREIVTVEELETFLERRLAKRPRQKGAKSLRGLF